MTIVERNNKLKHFITCLKCEISGKCCDDNCSTQYDAGNMGEIIENLEAILKVLERETILDKIRAEIEFEVDHRTNMLCAEDVFAILDKYKAETENI